MRVARVRIAASEAGPAVASAGSAVVEVTLRLHPVGRLVSRLFEAAAPEQEAATSPRWSRDATPPALSVPQISLSL